ncbi:MAG TPA: hypothetical protein VGA98_03475 [Allosphingosinicella sp.]
MAKEAQIARGRLGIPWRLIGWGTAALLLLLPFVAGAPWTGSDYVFAAVMFGTVGLAFEFVVRKSVSLAYRAGAVLAVVTAVMTIWINGAVGMIGSEQDDYNLLFLVVPLVALAGAAIARFRPAGTAWAMLAAAIAQAALGAFGLPEDLAGGILGIGFAGPWLVAALLFRKAGSARQA